MLCWGGGESFWTRSAPDDNPPRFLAGCFTLAVEGTLPAEPGNEPIFDYFDLTECHYFLLAMALGLNWVTILCSLRITDRISRYMEKVQEQQQNNLKGAADMPVTTRLTHAATPHLASE